MVVITIIKIDFMKPNNHLSHVLDDDFMAEKFLLVNGDVNNAAFNETKDLSERLVHCRR